MMSSNLSARRKLLFGLGCAAVVTAFVWHCLAVSYMSDDGYIALQYVRNFVRGEGLVYNPGERVEGYNNFLWLILLAGGVKLLPSISLLHLSQALGIVFGVLTIILVCRFSFTVREHPGPFGLLAGAFLAVQSGFAAWSTGGLETTMYAFLLFSSAYAYVCYLKTNRNYLLVPLLFGIASLTRPDAILLFGVTSLHFLVTEKRRTGKLLSSRLVLWAIVFVAIFVPYYAWRFSYYGYPMPNTYYTKVGGGRDQYVRGVLYILNFLKFSGGFIFLIPLLTLMRRKREAWRDYIALLIGVYLLYIVYVGGDGLAFFRFAVYITPLMYVLVQEGFIDAYELIRYWTLSTSKWKVAAAALALIVVGLTFTMRQTVFPLLFPKTQQWYEPQSELRFPDHGSHSYVWFDNYFVDRLSVAAKWLDKHAPPGSVVASTPAGSIAYHMNLPVIDMLGLNDTHIAHAPSSRMGKGRAGHEKGDGRYVLSRSPDFVLLGNVAVLSYPLDKAKMAKKLVLKSEHELWKDPEFHQNYALECVHLAESGPFQYFTFYKKKGLMLPAHTDVAVSSSEPVGGTQ